MESVVCPSNPERQEEAEDSCGVGEVGAAGAYTSVLPRVLDVRQYTAMSLNYLLSSRFACLTTGVLVCEQDAVMACVVS